MRTWLKTTVAVGLAGLSTIACAQPAQPAAPEPTPAPAADRAAPAARAAEADAEAQVARRQAVQVRGQAAMERELAAKARSDALRGVTIAMSGGKKEKVAFMGITSTRVTGALRANLNLERGVGLVIESVGKDSPAEKAGLVQYDILQKMDDQLLIFPEQLGVLTRLHKPGDEVTLTVVRKGQPQQIKLTLGEKEMYVDDEGMQKTMLGANDVMVAPEWTAGLGDKLKSYRLRVGDSSANYIFQDGDTTLEVNKKDDSRHLTAKDKDGKVIFDGAIDTDEQRKALPPAIADKLAKLDNRIKALPDSDNDDVKVRVLEP